MRLPDTPGLMDLAVGENMTGNTKASVIDVYQRHGAAWAGLRGDTLVEGSWLDRFCNPLPSGAEVLDIGCGSGLPIARELIRRGFDVTGLDGSATMLALFRRNLPGAPSLLADMRELALHRRFSGLLAWDSFFHLSPDDQRAMFRRFQAHAEPGAALMFTSGNAEGDAVGELGGDPLYHGSLDPDEYRTLLNTAGFEVVAHVAEDPTCGHRTVWLARQRRERRTYIFRRTRHLSGRP
jgi:SAM-dependent methyltransferase